MQPDIMYDYCNQTLKTMINIGIVSAHGLVGQYVTAKIQYLKKFENITIHHFARDKVYANNCFDIQKLMEMQIILSLAPSTYCLNIHPKLRENRWDGYWLDASSALRFLPSTCLTLPPVNATMIHTALKQGVKDFSGPNCTTSLLAIGLGPLLKEKAIASISVSTYQSLSGAGNHAIKSFQENANQHTSEVSNTTDYMDDFFKQDYQTLGQITPWIDEIHTDGMTREEYKMQAEIKKITGQSIELNAVCVRVPTLCTHAQTAFVTLHKETSLTTLLSNITGPFNKVIDNTQDSTSEMLAPKAVYNSSHIHVGRIRMLNSKQFSCYIIGDQLQWGASLPITSTLELLLDHIKQTTA